MPPKDEKLTVPTFEDFGGQTDELDAEDFSNADRGNDLADDKPAAEPEKAVNKEPEAAEEPAEGGVGEPETAEATEEPAAEEDTKEPEKAAEPSIPKSRFDQVNAAKKAAEEELATLKERLNREGKAAEAGSQQEYDFDAAEERYMEAVLDGKAAEAKAIRAEIRAAERAAYEALATTKATQTTQAAQTQREIDRIVSAAERDFPAFDPKNEEAFRPDLVEEVSAYFGTRLNLGDSAPVAMQRAVDAIAKIHGLAAPPAEDTKPAKGKVVTIPAGKDATKAKVAAAKKAPPTLATAGAGGDEAGISGELDVSKLTDKELDALPESTRRRLRGDFIAA
jgi:hypothetical protein